MLFFFLLIENLLIEFFNRIGQMPAYIMLSSCLIHKSILIKYQKAAFFRYKLMLFIQYNYSKRHSIKPQIWVNKWNEGRRNAFQAEQIVYEH